MDLIVVPTTVEMMTHKLGLCTSTARPPKGRASRAVCLDLMSARLRLERGDVSQ
jgi:hypothetical protein